MTPGDRGGQALRRAPAYQDDSVRPVGKIENPDPLAFSECACKTRLHQRPRVHDTRHLHVGWLIDDGWDLYAIQQRSGHESIKITFDGAATDYPTVTPIA